MEETRTREGIEGFIVSNYAMKSEIKRCNCAVRDEMGRGQWGERGGSCLSRVTGRNDSWWIMRCKYMDVQLLFMHPKGRNGNAWECRNWRRIGKVQHGNGCCRRMDGHKVIIPNIADRRWDMSCAHSCWMMGAYPSRNGTCFPVFRFLL